MSDTPERPNRDAEKLYKRLSRLKPGPGDEPVIRLLLTRAELALILPALRDRYGLGR
jgi:hypothetical protein